MSNIFEQATRQQLRFDLSIGQLSVEELWQLKPVKRVGKLVDDLLDYAKQLEQQLSSSSTSSVLSQFSSNSIAKSSEQQKLELQFAIVLHILQVRKDEAEQAKQLATKKVHNDKILALIAKKQEDNLGELSVDELTAMLK